MTPPKPRVVFMGTPDLARTVLQSLAEDGRWDLALVVAQPDKPVGRGLQLQAPPVKQEALARGLPVLQPLKARDPEFLAHLRTLAPDVIVVAAYGQLLPPALLEIPRRGCLNIHTSLLPRWRGAAPIQWALLEGDAETGVSLMLMNAGLDTGDVIAVDRTPISTSDTGQTLHDRLALLGGKLLERTLADWLEGRLTATPQPADGVTYARKLSKEDGRLVWSAPAETLARKVRALDPWPGAFTTFLPASETTPGAAPQLLKVWAAAPVDDAASPGIPGQILRADSQLLVATGSGALRLDVLQREGKKRMPAADFLRSGTVCTGQLLGLAPAGQSDQPAR